MNKVNILFLSRYKWPHVGGVERHVYEVSNVLEKRGFDVAIISSEEISYPQVKYFGLLYIWFWLFKNKSLILNADIIHCHDVFVWYLPFRFIYPFKKVFTTFHGWEGKYPIPVKNRLLKKLAAKLSNGNICVGKYIEKWYGIKSNYLTYGGVEIKRLKSTNKKARIILFVGRLEWDTGIRKLFNFLNTHKNYSVEFCGDGNLHNKCENYGRVHGFVDPFPYYKKASIVFASGYLTALEALTSGCKLIYGWDNQLKKDYWKLSPFVKKDAKKWALKQSWEEVSKIYLKLWKIDIV